MALSLVRREPITGATAWTAADLTDPDEYTLHLDEATLREMRQALQAIHAVGKDINTVHAEDFSLPSFTGLAEEVSRRLEHGRGFVVLRRLPVDDVSPDEACILYWGLGTFLGTPLPQNRQGDRVYLVQDEGKKLSSEHQVRGSKTNAELISHTDSASAFAGSRPDVVGMLMIRRAKSGGSSQLLSGHTLHNVVLEERPDLLPRLYEGYCWDRSAESGPGEDPTSSGPVFWRKGDAIHVRYNRYWIHRGHKVANVPLALADSEPLDFVDEVLRRKDLGQTFDLYEGDMLFLNNNVILHNRTGFEDHDEPERKRLLVRLWIQAHD